MAQFITIEGGEGAGKSTVMAVVKFFLDEHKIPHILTREPGGTPLAEKIRDLVLHNKKETIWPETELLLFFAGRYQHIAEVIKPALEKEIWVVSDRFVDASFAYQGAGRGISEERIRYLSDWLLGDLRPQLTLLLDTPPELGLARIQQRGDLDRIEEEKADFFDRIRACYLQMAAQEPKRFCIIDTSAPLLEVEEKVQTSLETWLQNL